MAKRAWIAAVLLGGAVVLAAQAPGQGDLYKIELIGGWGLLLGPLAVRLAKEAILIRSEAMAPTKTP